MLEIPSIQASCYLWMALYIYLAVEVIFSAVFYLYLIPRANQRTVQSPYRDYGRHRCRLLFRVLDRVVTFAEKTGVEPRKAMSEYILSCFQPIDSTDLSTTSPLATAKMVQQAASPSTPSQALLHDSQESMSTSSISSLVDLDDNSGVVEKNNEQWTVPQVGKEDMRQLFGWALFGKELHEFEAWECEEMEECFHQLEVRLGLVFESGSTCRCQPRRLHLENVTALHRPLLIYLYVMLMKIVAGLCLRLWGYERVVSTKTGLVGWYKKALHSTGEKMLPILFFHGVAPGGLLFYLPMIFRGLANYGRTVFLFENPNISCSLGFKALREEETVLGAFDIVNQFLPHDRGLCLVGHSFGIVPLTWLLHAPQFRHRIRQFVVLDPVTILLTDTDVMVNFLYRKEVSKIRLVAGSELFVEYYLRRHFYHYNSELWLDDIPNSVQTLVALSGADEIVNSSKVKNFIELFGNPESLSRLYWKYSGHAHCVAQPQKWKDIKDAMLQGELSIVHETGQQLSKYAMD